MNNSLFILAIFWGVWIIIPVVFDGFLTFIYMIYILIKAPKPHPHQLDPGLLPKVSIIIPTYNEEENINECLNYLKIQTYPQEKIEIIVVDNGSTDETSEIVKSHMKEIWQNQKSEIRNPKQIQNSKFENGNHNGLNGKLKVDGQTFQTNGFGGLLRLIVRYEKGKAKALNTGIKLAGGEIIINIDCRSFLAPDAIYNMVAKFIEYPEYGAATGNVEIDWNLLYERKANGQYVFDGHGHYQPRFLSRKEKFLGKSQFMEYLTSFRIGRQFQDITGSIYTFSGAFSAFRRQVLLKSHLYSSRTVAEDTDLTLDLHGQNVRLGYAEEAKAFLKPVISFEKFYAQRIRWHRGQIEVIGLHLDFYGNFRQGFGRAFWHSILLVIDHTFGFPRIIWTFLLPLFFLFGYSVTLILQAIILMYAFYVLVDFLNACYCWRIADKETRQKIKNTLHYAFVTPIFRLITFYFRFAAYLEVLKEPQAWTTPINPIKSVKGYRETVRGGYQKTSSLGNKIWQIITGRKVKPTIYEEKIAEMDSFGLERTGDLTGEQKEIVIDTNLKPVNNGKKMDGLYQSFDYKER